MSRNIVEYRTDGRFLILAAMHERATPAMGSVRTAPPAGTAHAIRNVRRGTLLAHAVARS